MSPLTVSFDQSACRWTLGQWARDQGDAEVIKSTGDGGKRARVGVVARCSRSRHNHQRRHLAEPSRAEPLFSSALHVPRYIRARARPPECAAIDQFLGAGEWHGTTCPGAKSHVGCYFWPHHTSQESRRPIYHANRNSCAAPTASSSSSACDSAHTPQPLIAFPHR